MKKILLIEDNPDIRTNTAEILELSNYQVMVADNGVAGVSMAIEFHPDLIICDIMMPDLDGYGVLHAIQKNDALKNTPFIFLTAKTERSDIRKGMDLGADDYITKPFTGTELLNAVDTRLKKRESLKQELAGLQGVTDLMNDSGEVGSLEELTSERNITRCRKKQVIYTQGNHPGRLYYILKGKVKTLITNNDGKDLVNELYGPGDFLGHLALLEGTVYQDTAVALEPTDLAVIPKSDFDGLLNKNHEVAQKFIRLLDKNISEKEKFMLHLAYDSLRRKVADALLRVQKKFLENKGGDLAIEISRESLATIAGTATESLIRTLSDFKNEKLIDIKNGDIFILNRHKLENMVN